MSQRVRCDAHRQSGFEETSIEKPSDAPIRQRSTSMIQEETIARLLRHPLSSSRQIVVEGFACEPSDRGETNLVTFAEEPRDGLIQVERFRRHAASFAHPCAGAVEKLEQRSVSHRDEVGARRRGEETFYFRRRENRRQATRTGGNFETLTRIIRDQTLLAQEAEELAQCRRFSRESGAGIIGGGQRCEVGAQVVGLDLFETRRAGVIVRPRRKVTEIRRVGAAGVVGVTSSATKFVEKPIGPGRPNFASRASHERMVTVMSLEADEAGRIDVVLPFVGDAVDLLEALGRDAQPVLLENREHGPRAQIAIQPREEFRWSWTEDGDHVNPFTALRDLFERHRPPPASLPDDVAFAGGLVGYFGYDVRLATERLPASNPPDSSLPDVWFGVYDTFFDIAEAGRVRLILLPRAGESSTEREARAASITARMTRATSTTPSSSTRHADTDQDDLCPIPAVSNLAPETYRAGVQRILDHIRSGDVYQVNFTHRFLVRCDDSPLEVYRRLRAINPAPYSAFFQVDDTAVLSISPECLVRADGVDLESRPIKGTRARAAEPSRDVAAVAALRTSPKDHAELTMIVDLVRNDLSRVCAPGTVTVHDHAHVESATYVHHLVTAVRGRLESPHDIFDALAALLPGGSITGAPKIRSMEIIDELETVARGLYTGSIGRIDWRGRTDFSIAIRTLVLEAGYARIHGGGGIVIDSDPDREYQESLDKVRGLLEAVRAEVRS